MSSVKTLEIGTVYGRLTVIGNTVVNRYSAAICRCECGNIKTIRRYSITHGNKGKKTRSCGCLARDIAMVNLKVNRGSSFISDEARISSRKAWLKEYMARYSSDPEQRKKRAIQRRAWLDAMPKERRDAYNAKKRENAARPERKEKARKADAEYYSKPENIQRRKDRSKEFYKNAKEQLSDAYVLSCFLQESKLKKEDVPKEVIEAARMVMKVRRFVRKKDLS